MDKELRQMEGLIKNRKDVLTGDGRKVMTGTVGNSEIILAKSGIGKVCSAVGCMELIDNFHPDCIINTGVAGGLGKGVKPLDVVIGTDTAYHDAWCGEGCARGQISGFPAAFPCDVELTERLVKICGGMPQYRILRGKLCSGDSFIAEKAEYDRIKTEFPEAVAVDMESTAIAHVCYMKKTPFACMKIISDMAIGESHENIALYNDFWEIAPEISFNIIKSIIERL